MKKVVLVLLSATTALFISCRAPQNINGNGNANGNANSNRNLNEPPLPPGLKQQKLEIKYTAAATPNPATYTISGPDPDPVRLSIKGQEKLRWCITYSGPDEIKVTMDNFVDKSNGKHDPFEGTGNKVVVDHIKQGEPINCTGLTGKPKDATQGTYKYKITVTLPNGTDFSLDPVVIIDN